MHQFEACNREEIRCWSGNILVEPPVASLLGVGVDSRSCLIAVAIVSGDSLIQRVALCCVLGYFSRLPAVRVVRNNSPENMDRYMAWQSAQGVERARSGCGVTLDYRADSAKEVENLLATKYDRQRLTP